MFFRLWWLAGYRCDASRTVSWLLPMWPCFLGSYQARTGGVQLRRWILGSVCQCRHYALEDWPHEWLWLLKNLLQQIPVSIFLNRSILSTVLYSFLSIGRLILTKKPFMFDPNGDRDREDITLEYKAKEGTEAERLSLYNAVRGTERAKR